MGLDTTRYEARRRIRGSVALTSILAAFAVLVVYLYPSIAESSADIDALIQAFPESVRQGLGIEAYSSIEGFVAAELYQFLWILLLGLYMAYTAGGAFAGDIESKRLYLVLATPISRARLLVEKTLALLTPLVVLNLVLPLVVFGTTILIDYPIDPAYLLAVHAVSIPYHLVCLGIGQVLSIAFSRGNTAQLGGIAIIFLLFLLDSVTAGTDYEWLGRVSPTRYVDPTEVLLEETIRIGDAVFLLAVALLLLFASLLVFQSRDV
ncbi:ABC transporter permease [Halobellus clavatus]|uniref:ABC-2 type transport system permease protein n=1 Tax=Halobellus clavatus TaxID=660517 RepID=A0A1H3HUY6_9EURY|nr:ABC transporter permease subunit [Halobellus clavatus]SDY19316.1 ABC-2 type transport system permease protein [Halobellus clavatus]